MDARELKNLRENLDGFWNYLADAKDPDNYWSMSREEFVELLSTLRSHAGDATMWQTVDRWLER